MALPDEHVITDQDVLLAMIKEGGSFVRSLGEAGIAADAENLKRIKRTWPEYWREYMGVAWMRKKRRTDKAEI